MKIPAANEIEQLHREHAPTPEAFDSVWTHCQIVGQLAVQFVEAKPVVDKDLVKAGALLHDIGVYRLYDDGQLNVAMYITHGLRGYELLKEEGYDEALCRFALVHTGVGLTKEDITKQALPLPVADYLPSSEEEKIVMYADKFHSKMIVPTFNSVEWYREHISQYGDDKLQIFNDLVTQYGEPELQPLMSRYGQDCR